MMNEKLAILKMLEDGKITAAEAARLLESVEPTVAEAKPVPAVPAIPPSVPAAAHKDASANSAMPGGAASNGAVPGGVTSGKAMPGGAAGQKNNFENIASDLGRKFEAFAKDFEPKLQKITETVAEKIVSGTERISKGIDTMPRPAQPAAAPAPSRGTTPGTARSAAVGAASGTEKNIELMVADGYNELSLSGINGDVRIRGYNGDKITARIICKPKRGKPDIDLVRLGGKYYLNYEEDDFERVSVDAYVPERRFQVIRLEGLNGNMDVSSLAAREIQIINTNGQTRLTGLAAENIKAECSNGQLTLMNIAADSAIIENFNGIIQAEELDIEKLSLTNYNGPLTLFTSMFTRYTDYQWAVETSNAKLTIHVPTSPDLGYHIKAHTTLGEIRLGLTGLQFLINDPALAEARSSCFDRSAKKVRLTAETSGAVLMIN